MPGIAIIILLIVSIISLLIYIILRPPKNINTFYIRMSETKVSRELDGTSAQFVRSIPLDSKKYEDSTNDKESRAYEELMGRARNINIPDSLKTQKDGFLLSANLPSDTDDEDTLTIQEFIDKNYPCGYATPIELTCPDLFLPVINGNNIVTDYQNSEGKSFLNAIADMVFDPNNYEKFKREYAQFQSFTNPGITEPVNVIQYDEIKNEYFIKDNSRNIKISPFAFPLPFFLLIFAMQYLIVGEDGKSISKSDFKRKFSRFFNAPYIDHVTYQKRTTALLESGD